MVPVAHPHPEIPKVPPPSAVFSKIRFSGFTCPAMVNSFFRDDYTSCILNLLLTNKYTVLGFLKRVSVSLAVTLRAEVSFLRGFNVYKVVRVDRLSVA